MIDTTKTIISPLAKEPPPDHTKTTCPDGGCTKIDGNPGPVVVAKKESIHIAAVVDANACEKPAYPCNSVLNEETGVVTLALLIGIDGRVIDSRVDKSSGSKDLDKAARIGLSLCKFKPGSTDGVPEQSWTKIQYVWNLE